MTKHTARAAVIAFLGLWSSGALVSQAAADDGELRSVLVTAKDAASQGPHLLRYKFSQGEKVQWKVTHLGTTEATVRGNTQTSKMRTVSTKQWEVTDVDSDGNATFVHSVVDVEMWQKVSDRQEVRYDSRTDATPPPEYAHVAKSLGVPIATIKVSPAGAILERDKAPLQSNSGLGDIVMPLPEEAVTVGHDWYLPNEVRVRRPDGQQLRVKTRIVYTLQAVKTGIATIGVKTEVLTPVNDPAIKGQLVQQLTNGTVKFDIDAGRVYSQQIDWDETVVGFNGADSLMKYLARFTEELIPADTLARQPADAPVR